MSGRPSDGRVRRHPMTQTTPSRMKDSAHAVAAGACLMERRIRRLGIFMVLCFLALFIQLNNIQVIKANSLANDPNNPAVLDVARSQPRGSILSSDGVVLASSVPTNGGVDKYRRVYNPDTATLFAQIVGYDSPIYSETGVEYYYNKYLESHTRPAHSLRDLLVDRTTTDNVTLTINSHLQLQVASIVEGIDADNSAPNAAAVVLDVKTGAVEAMYGLPTYNPTGLVSPSTKVENDIQLVRPGQPGEPPRLPGLPERFRTGLDVQGGDLRRRLRPRPLAGQRELPVHDVHQRSERNGAAAHPGSPDATLQLRGRQRLPRTMRREHPSHFATIVRHRLRPVGPGPQLESGCRGAGFRVQPAATHRPHRCRSLELPISRLPHRRPGPGRHGGLRSGLRERHRRRHPAADGPGRRRHRQPGSHHDAARHAVDPRLAGEPCRDLHAHTVAHRHEPPHRRGSDQAHAGSRDEWDGGARRVPGFVERRSQDRNGGDGPHESVDQRLDDRLRPGQ